MPKISTKQITTDHNLRALLAKSDKIDRSEGTRAYRRYNKILKKISEAYGFKFPATVAAFCALSPNNDYMGNLRSLVSVMVGLNEGVPVSHIKISTYNHCKERAALYLQGEEFVTKKRGLKTLSFYHNIINPECVQHITIDGHMVAAFLGRNLVMKEALISTRSEYHRVANIFKGLAFEIGTVPNQLQATLWFTRKRIYRVKYCPNLDLFNDKGDCWGINVPLEAIVPYGFITR